MNWILDLIPIMYLCYLYQQRDQTSERKSRRRREREREREIESEGANNVMMTHYILISWMVLQGNVNR